MLLPLTVVYVPLLKVVLVVETPTMTRQESPLLRAESLHYCFDLDGDDGDILRPIDGDDDRKSKRTTLLQMGVPVPVVETTPPRTTATEKLQLLVVVDCRRSRRNSSEKATFSFAATHSGRSLRLGRLDYVFQQVDWIETLGESSPELGFFDSITTVTHHGIVKNCSNTQADWIAPVVEVNHALSLLLMRNDGTFLGCHSDMIHFRLFNTTCD